MYAKGTNMSSLRNTDSMQPNPLYRPRMGQAQPIPPQQVGTRLGEVSQQMPNPYQPYVNNQGQQFTGTMSFAPGTSDQYRQQAYGGFANSQGYSMPSPIDPNVANSPSPERPSPFSFSQQGVAGGAFDNPQDAAAQRDALIQRINEAKSGYVSNGGVYLGAGAPPSTWGQRPQYNFEALKQQARQDVAARSPNQDWLNDPNLMVDGADFLSSLRKPVDETGFGPGGPLPGGGSQAPGYGTAPDRRGGTRTADFRDRDMDGVDDRDQDGPGMPGYGRPDSATTRMSDRYSGQPQDPRAAAARFPEFGGDPYAAARAANTSNWYSPAHRKFMKTQGAANNRLYTLMSGLPMEDINRLTRRRQLVNGR